MRTPLIAGNWKMNTTVSEATKLVLDMQGELDGVEGVEKVLCPPFVSLSAVEAIVRGSSVKLGAQNMHFEEKGAYTGEISPSMLRQMCQFVILGHSERRMYFGETDEIVNRKVKAALAGGLRPILCIGERLEDNEAGRTEEVLRRQVTGDFQGIDRADVSHGSERCDDAGRDLVIAYEPVWAIGTGKAASGKEAVATVRFVRNVLAELWGVDTTRGVRILYGGSVTTANIAEFISDPEIDGALVGGASLKADDFVGIVRQTAEIKGSAR